MERMRMKADVREVGKKGVNRRLRKQGLVPAVLYGRQEKPAGLFVSAREFMALMKGAAGINALIDLEVTGTQSPSVVMLKDYQTDALTRHVTHIDLLKIDLTAKVTVKIPIHLIGKCIGLSKGGLIDQSRREIEVKCLPGNIPDQIDVDITHLDIGHSIHINELKFPEGLEAPHGVDFTIVSIVAPKEEEAAPVAAPVEGAAAVPAAGAAAAAPGAVPAAPAAGEAKAEKGEKAGKSEKKEKK